MFLELPASTRQMIMEVVGDIIIDVGDLNEEIWAASRNEDLSDVHSAQVLKLKELAETCTDRVVRDHLDQRWFILMRDKLPDGRLKMRLNAGSLEVFENGRYEPASHENLRPALWRLFGMLAFR